MKKEKIKFKLKERLKAVVFSKKIKYNSIITILMGPKYFKFYFYNAKV